MKALNIQTVRKYSFFIQLFSPNTFSALKSERSYKKCHYVDLFINILNINEYIIKHYVLI